MIFREDLPYIASLRYRHNEQPRLLRQNCNTGVVVGCKDYECRHRITELVYIEMLDDRRCNSVQDAVDLWTKEYTD
jgi:hypothetical protein